MKAFVDRKAFDLFSSKRKKLNFHVAKVLLRNPSYQSALIVDVFSPKHRKSHGKWSYLKYDPTIKDISQMDEK
jgi:hypothetical protein